MESSELIQENQLNRYILEDYDRMLKSVTEIDNPQRKCHILNEVYKMKLKYFRLKQSELNDWLEAIHLMEDTHERVFSEFEFYSLISPDYTNVDVTSSFLKHFQEFKDLDESGFEAKLLDAINISCHDFSRGNLIWKQLIDAAQDEYLKVNSDTNLMHLHQYYLDRLAIPHAQLEESFNEYSSFISKYYGDDYDKYMKYMKSANKIYSSTKMKQIYYEQFEISIKQSPDNPQLWIDYMESVYSHQKKKDLNPVLAIFERAILKNESWSQNWIKIWLALIYIIYGCSSDQRPEWLQFVFQKFLRTFPNSNHAYAESIRYCLTMNDNEMATEEFQSVESRLESTKKLLQWDHQQWKSMHLAFIQFNYQISKRYSMDNNKLIVELSSNSIFMRALSVIELGDPSHSVEFLAVDMLTHMGATDMAKDLIDLMLEKFNNEAEVLLFGLRYFVIYKTDFGQIRSYFKNAIHKLDLFDLPEKLCDKWLEFEQLYGDINSYMESVAKCEIALKTLSKKRTRDITVDENNQPSKKHKREPTKDIDTETKSRETCTVKVKNIAADTDEHSIRDFFKDCGEIGDISFVEAEGIRYAIFDFENEQQVFSALTKNYKSLDGNKLEVYRLQNALLFVNNYPSTFSQATVKEMFEKIGPVAKIRFPNQTLKKIKRFCYVQMISNEDAQKIIDQYHGQKYDDPNLGGEFSWEIKFSNPEEKHERSSPISARKVKVTSISFNVLKEAFEKKFALCGEIEQVVFPKAVYEEDGKLKSNGGLAIVTYKTIEGVENALKLNDSKWMGRKLFVSKKHQHVHYTAEDFDGVKTIGLCGLDPSLNFQQVKTVFEERFGKVAKVLLFPEDKQALVEFVKPGDAGKTSMSNNFVKLGESEAKIVTKEEITMGKSAISNTTTTPSAPLTMIPTTVRRKKSKK